MSQAGYTPIQLYYSTTASAVPSAGNLANGEPALNITDGKLYYKNNSGVVTLLASAAGASGDVVGPASATDNALVRFDTTTGKLVQNSAGILDDSGNLSGLAAVTATSFAGALNGTVGATTPNTGAFTTLSASGAVTLSGGTANGVAYLNGSKVLTSGSALTFDGTTFATIGFGRFGNGGRIEGTGSALAGTGVGAEIFASGGIAYYTSYDRTGAAYSPLISIAGSYQAWNVSGEQMRLTSTGLGIGTSSPAQKLQVAGGRIRMSSDNVNGGDIAVDGTGLAFSTLGTTQPIIFSRNNYATESMRLDSSGNLGLGVTPSAWSGLKAFEFAGVGSSLASAANNNVFLSANAWYNGSGWRYGISAAATQYQSFNGFHAWFTAPSGTAGNAISFTQAMTLDASGNLGVGQTNPSAWLVNGVGIGSGTSDWGATIYTGTASSGYLCFADGASGTDRYRGYLQYNHILDAMLFGTATTERARIDSSGNLLVGTTGTAYQNSDSFNFDKTNKGLYVNHINGTTTGFGYVGFGYNGSSIGSITQSGTTAVLYNTTSDQRLKENIQDAASASALIDALQVREYDWKSDGSHQRYGFIAQELVTVAPEAVHQPADPEAMMAVDYSKLVPMLVKEIQSLRQRLAALEAA
jgi:hypothetical protein